MNTIGRPFVALLWEVSYFGYIPNIRTKKQNNVRILIDPVFVVG